jgi:hypothetical protein
MTPSTTPGHAGPRDPKRPSRQDARATSDDAGHDGVTGTGGGKVVGGYLDDLDNATLVPAGTTHGDADRADADGDDVPIGSALASATGIDGDRRGSNPTAGGDADLTSGPSTLGATTGGERASAGRADANRNSRDHGNSLDS